MSSEDLLYKVGAETSGFDNSLKAMGANLLKFTAGFFAIQKAGDMFKYMAVSAIEGEKSLNLLTNSIMRAHGGSAELVSQMDVLSKNLAKTYGISDDVIKNGFMRMTDATGNATAAFKGMEPAIALSVARNIDLTKAMDLVTRAYMTGTDSLKREKVYMDENFKGKAALDAITKKYAGTMAAYAKTNEAILKGTNESFAQTAKTIGILFLPAVANVAKELKSAVEWWDTFFGRMKEKMKEARIAEYTKNANIEIAKLDEQFTKFSKNHDLESNIGQTYSEHVRKKIAIIKNTLAEAIASETTTPFVPEGGSSEAVTIKDKNKDKDKGIGVIATEGQLAALKDAAKYQTAYYDNINSAQLSAEQQKYNTTKDYGEKIAQLQSILSSSQIQETKNTSKQLMDLMKSRNKTLFEIGKAAAIANITIETAESAMNIYKSFSKIPVAGAALAAIGAGVAIAYGADRMAEVALTNFNPKGAATGLFNDTSESLISTFKPSEAVIPQRFSEGIRRGEYALTSGNTTNNNGGTVHFSMNINSNGLDNAASIVRDQIIPEFKKYLINERGGTLGRITGNTVTPNF